MTREELDKFIKYLNDNGYVKSTVPVDAENYYMYKGFGKAHNPWEHGRNLYQILFKVYIEESVEPTLIGISVDIVVSRTIHERFDLSYDIDDATESALHDAKVLAIKFFNLIAEVYPEPKE